MILNSPTASQFGEAVGGRLPKQIQRALPLYIAIILLLLFLSNSDSFTSSPKEEDVNVSKRAVEYQTTASRDATYSSSFVIDSKFPKKIWQSWKVDPLGFDERDSNTARTWTQKNPGHRYEVLTDNNDLYYVETHFGPNGLNRMDIVEMYRSLTAKIVKADLLRYLVMYVEGGVYADIDVEALRPINRFIPERYNEDDINLVISVEIDQPEFNDHPILGKKSQSFCQWTFMAKPRLPVMLRLIDNIMIWLNDVSKRQGVPISDIHLDFDEVISGTGPSAFTAAILTEMSISEKEPITWSRFHSIRESKLVGGVLVLTVEAFAAGQGHSDSGNHNARTALVKHHYHASGWPTAHPRYKHPVYGEVERCNWEAECVRIWDENKVAFEALTPDEQKKVIEFKEAADRDSFLQQQKLAFEALSPEDQAKLAVFDNPQRFEASPVEPAPVPNLAPAFPAPAPALAPFPQVAALPAAAPAPAMPPPIAAVELAAQPVPVAMAPLAFPAAPVAPVTAPVAALAPAPEAAKAVEPAAPVVPPVTTRPAPDAAKAEEPVPVAAKTEEKTPVAAKAEKSDAVKDEDPAKVPAKAEKAESAKAKEPEANKAEKPKADKAENPEPAKAEKPKAARPKGVKGKASKAAKALEAEAAKGEPKKEAPPAELGVPEIPNVVVNAPEAADAHAPPQVVLKSP